MVSFFIEGCSFVVFYNVKYFFCMAFTCQMGRCFVKLKLRLTWTFDMLQWFRSVIESTGDQQAEGPNIENFLVSTTYNVLCYIVLIFFQTISISMLLRYCHHQIFVFIGKSKLFFC